MRNPLFSWLFSMLICSLQLSFCIFVASGQCLGDQQSLLLQLKNSLAFSSDLSTKLVYWNQSVDCCLWEGVNCAEGRVIGLDLTNESISGELDNLSSLFNLSYLQSLNLAYNNFNSSQISSEFDKLTNLSYLNLSNAGFDGQIPMAISRLTRLVTLDLSAVYFPEATPLKLENPNLSMLVQNLPDLLELYLDGVNISAQGNEWCSALSSSLLNLRVLSLSNCYLTGQIPPSLANLTLLESLGLSRNNLIGEIPIQLAKGLTFLSFLDLSFNQLVGRIPIIKQFATFSEASFAGNKGLCGLPLKAKCPYAESASPPTFERSH